MSLEDVSANINTYHCICTTLVLATAYDLSLLPKRTESADGASILPLSTPRAASPTTTSVLHNLVSERKRVTIKRDDGFEKRVLLRCARCDLVLGYKLDKIHFNGSQSQAEGIVYVLPGSLLRTEAMKLGHKPETPAWAQKD